MPHRPAYTERVRHILMTGWNIDHIHIMRFGAEIEPIAALYCFGRRHDGSYILEPGRPEYKKWETKDEAK